MRQGDAAIRLLDDVSQEVALGERLHITRIRRVAVSHLPPDVGIQPVLIQFLLSKEVIERNLASQFCALDRTCHLIESSVQVTLVDILLYPGRVVEQFLHHTAIANVLLCKFLLYHLDTHAVLQAIQISVALVHIIHIMLAGIMEDMKFRIHAEHLLQTVLHREDASDNQGASSLDIRITGKNLRESLHHSSGNTLMLESSERSQFAIAPLRLLANQLHLSQRFLALSSQFALLLRFEQRKIRHIISLLANHIAGTMPAIMTQIEWLITLRSCSQLLLRTTISHIVTTRERNVSLEILLWSLCSQRHRQCKRCQQ